MRTLNQQKSSSKSQIISNTPRVSQKIYNHSPETLLTIDDPPKIENIYNIPVNNITKSTQKFKGRMITYLTHGFYIYPAKFIPQIPQFCIKQFSQPYDTILDPFCGSGSTLLEAQLLHRNGFGIDINPLAQLISKVKTTPLDLRQFSEEYSSIEKFLNGAPKKFKLDKEPLPYFPNLSYWFTPAVQQDLRKLQHHIFHIDNIPIRNLLLLILTSIVRNVSLADNDQLHPARTKFSKEKEGKKIQPFRNYRKSLRSHAKIIEAYSQYDFTDVKIQLLEQDATHISCPAKVDLAITSPPYVNALDYVRIHKLEGFWAGLLQAEEIQSLHRQFIGTENVYKDYYYDLPEFSNKELNQVIAKIAKFDRKRAGIVTLYFMQMRKNLQEVFSQLRQEGHYCIVIGSNNIRNINIPTPKIFIEFAENEIGYKNVINYSYDIINKRLKIPRARHGGSIKKEWILVLQKL